MFRNKLVESYSQDWRRNCWTTESNLDCAPKISYGMHKREVNVSDFYRLEDACPYSSENVFVPETLDWVSIVPIYCQKRDPNRLFI